MPKAKGKKKTAAFLRYKSEHHLEQNKLKRVLQSSGSAAMLDWAAKNACLDLAQRYMK